MTKPARSQDGMESALPLAVPQDQKIRTLLVIMRRMAIHGLHDARAGQLAITAYRTRFDQILTLARLVLHETALASRRCIQIASCCTPRMTRDEALMLDVIILRDREAFAALTDNEAPSRAMTAAIALGDLVRA